MSVVDRVEVFKIEVPLEKPFTTALGTTTKLQEIIVRVTDSDGTHGWGEASPSKRTLATSLEGIVVALDEMAPLLVGMDPRRIAYITSQLDISLAGNTSAKAAIDIALHDLVGKIYGDAVWRILGGQSSEQVVTCYSIGIGSRTEMLAEGQDAVSQGFRVLKIKVGNTPSEDVETVRQFRDTFGQGVKLTLDANQGWSRRDAVRALAEMASYNVDLVEQPVVAHDLAGMAWVRARSAIPVMADESVHSPEDALRVIQNDAADYINIKLMKTGGLLKATRLAAIAEAAGVPCMVGAESETNLGITASVHFALATKAIFLADLGIAAKEETWFVETGGSRITNGCHILDDQDAPGLGVKAVKETAMGSPIRVYGNA